ncbi:MAG: sulfite exporter TauE/SafE family protein [Cyclobacteriaceae bacterium]
MEIAGFIGAVLIGVTLGLLGGGGSILTIPILVYLFKMEVVPATAYSLFIVGTTSLVGIIPKYKAKHIDFRTGLTFGIPSLASVFITRKWIVPAIPDIILTLDSFALTKRILVLGLFALLMIATSYSMIKGRRELIQKVGSKRVLQLVIQGVGIGLLTGLVGAGGGFLIIPALVLLAGLPMKVATGTSLFIIGINSLLGFTGDVMNLDIAWPFLLTIALLSVIGILIGNRLVGYFSSQNLRKAFGWFTMIMGTGILLRELVWGGI